MATLKLPPYSAHILPGGKPLFSFPASTPFFAKSASPLFPDYKLAMPTGSTTRVVRLFGPGILLYQHKKAKGLSAQQFITRSSSASVQPVTEASVENKSKDLPVTGDSIRRRFLDFYASRGHKVLPSSSLVPDDPTVLLTIAGMLQFKPIFLGKVPRQIPRATTAQRCIRTNDVENVGRTARHHTFFEMLGNFSFGDYFKKDAIKWAWELSTVEFGLPVERLWISIYQEDDEAFDIWHHEVGVPVERIKRMGEDDNFWTSGATGPCGPCSEIYYDFHPERGSLDVFYAESGGQIGDCGFLYVTGSENQRTAVVEIKDVQKSLGNIFVHKGTIREGVLEVGKEVEAAVDAKLRQRAKVHHTATHLLQAALKTVIGQETSQAGSLVAFDRLRFDFNFHRPLLDSELEEIEGLINGWIGDATLLQTKVMPLDDAKRAGAIAMFGEKYSEQVRVVEVPGISMELCGGTHVSNTAEIRAFKIMSEQGIASGIRRIEAVAGEAFLEYMNARDSQIKRLCSTLKVRAE
ncbi:alanine--tRNA ligase, chloroplastic/mitochondrial, partial [Carica papaya]|uniref:alanine--tRNA ligase, chloroplastic/mitochondrial n=1 Tax=Carica papaya TaxID=3649 RepID=UPI000B8D13F7